MIRGVVNDGLEATIRLTVRGPSGRTCRVEAVIDTGFDGALSLPPSLIAELDLEWQETGSAMLADGNLSSFDIYEATVSWDRQKRVVSVDEADTFPLIGTELLDGYELVVAFRRRGRVTIKALS